ncbi:MAG TPA: 3-deoxy-8-phosphooctulonate synthase [Bacteroidota bacterium]|nr:3-deoxy-8-phosphooctulonate synthase [Bacteroidota bacterium]
MKSFTISSIPIGGGNPLVLIAGPCVVENRDMIFTTAQKIKEVTTRLGIPFIFKSSYKKANRTSMSGFVSIGMDEALAILSDVKSQLKIPILTDVHTAEEVAAAAQVADVIQIPAFLCRQTELLIAAGKTGKAVNVKKGQFLAPEDMKHPIEKVASTGNEKIMVTERGATFGYHNLVVDMRGLTIMRSFGYPVILDATHSVQLPSGDNGKSGGEPQHIFPIARAGVAVGIDGLFIETHPEPAKALSDSASQLPLSHLEGLVRQVLEIDSLAKRYGWS